jgi:predicted phage terminase large subunit-like protein
MNEESRYLNAILRSDFHSFIRKCFGTINPAEEFLDNWHLRALAWHLEECLKGNIRRLIITLPPRYMKSLCASVAFPAFALGHDPSKKIICSGYSADVARKPSRDCRIIMQSSWYKDLFPHTRISSDKNTEMEFTTTARGYRLTTSVGGTLTGRGGNLIIVDDPISADDATSASARNSVCEWYDRTLCTRSDNKTSDTIIMIMQRLHMDDPVGHLLAKGGEKWVHLNLPVIAQEGQKIQIGPDKYHYRKVGDLLHAEREPLATLDSIKSSMGSYHYTAQYLQNPIPIDGQIFKKGWFQPYDVAPTRTADTELMLSWDMASKGGELNDYSVCTAWLIKNKMYYLLDVFRDKLNYPELKQAVFRMAEKFQGATMLIEDTAAGTAMLAELKNSKLAKTSRIRGIIPIKDKVNRASTTSHLIESGKVWLPRTAPWLDTLYAELLQFPSSRYDDQVDSITQFLGWVARQRKLMRMVPITGV